MNIDGSSLVMPHRRANVLAVLAGAGVACAWVYCCLWRWTFILFYDQVEPFSTPGFLVLSVGVPVALVGASYCVRKTARGRRIATMARRGFVGAAVLCALAVIVLIFSLGW